jgi:hypothetical protein
LWCGFQKRDQKPKVPKTPSSSLSQSPVPLLLFAHTPAFLLAQIGFSLLSFSLSRQRLAAGPILPLHPFLSPPLLKPNSTPAHFPSSTPPAHQSLPAQPSFCVPPSSLSLSLPSLSLSPTGGAHCRGHPLPPAAPFLPPWSCVAHRLPRRPSLFPLATLSTTFSVVKHAHHCLTYPLLYRLSTHLHRALMGASCRDPAPP